LIEGLVEPSECRVNYRALVAGPILNYFKPRVVSSKFYIMSKIAIFIITLYQKIFSLETGFFVKIGFFRKRTVCFFYPSCSQYAKIAVEKHGFFHGTIRAVFRILRCHPLQKNQIDLP